MKLTNSMRDAFVRAAMDDVPKVDYDEQTRKVAMAAALKMMPPGVRLAYKNHPEYFRSEYFHHTGCSVSLPMARNTELPADALDKIKAITALDTAQGEARGELKHKLRSAAYSCNTRKALAELLPEFEKYLPADESAAIKTLPVIANLVSDFVKAGWPKGGKQRTAVTA